ncbi:MAG: 50S ribosomal protein L11 methyltransferase [Paludibacteraceae bacterium]|nr:50S ribosomal protein L11 methyltransferase [Paludibacteraceae bacterium]
MKYVKICVDVTFLPEYEADVITYNLSEYGCCSFETTESGKSKILNAYIDKTIFNIEGLTALLENYNFSFEDMPDKDWNEEWEQNSFKPVTIDNRCVVCGTSHTDVPECRYKILINPKMAFGSGSHQTTSMMLEWILDDDFEGKKVLDMGCGTAVLGILAARKGASEVTGIDIDEWSVNNAKENISMNGVSMNVELGSASQIGNRCFDVIFANINLNILLADMETYTKSMNKGGTLYMSGFYKEDMPKLEQCAKGLGLRLNGFKEKDNWVACKFCSGIEN